MKGSVEAAGVTASVEATGEAVHLSLSDDAGRWQATATFEADNHEWTVGGVWDAGEPVPLLMVCGGRLAHINPNGWPGGVWRLVVVADTPQDAANAAVVKAKRTLEPPHLMAADASDEQPWKQAS